MLLQAAWLYFVLNVSGLDYQDLVDDVKNTLDACIGILEDVGRYLDEVSLLQDVSRRAEDENDYVGTEVKLHACFSILKAVDSYREDHMRVVRYQNILRLEEQTYLNERLKPFSKKMGDGFYVASVDGDEISDFQTACGDLNSMLIIVETVNGTVFGGYNDAGCGDNWQRSSNVFLFRLRPSYGHYPISVNRDQAFGILSDRLSFCWNLEIFDHALSNSKPLSNGFGQFNGLSRNELNDYEANFQAKEWVAVEVVDL